MNIKFFFYIGGNDSMDTCYKISQYFKAIHFECMVIGVPKTIDNDLVHTDHTPGYGSSIKYIATTIAEIYQDIECYKKVRLQLLKLWDVMLDGLQQAQNLLHYPIMVLI